MSDKLFFKGRQDARQNHIKYGYQSKRSSKSGSKKHPLSLVVTNEARQKEVEGLVAEAELFAEISIDNSVGAAVTNTKSVVDRNLIFLVREVCNNLLAFNFYNLTVGALYFKGESSE